MNLRIKYKTLKRENESLNKQLKILDSTISEGMKYQEHLKCKIAVKNVLFQELESKNRYHKDQVENLQRNTEILYNNLHDKSIQAMELQKEIDLLKKQEYIKPIHKNIFKRIFA